MKIPNKIYLQLNNPETIIDDVSWSTSSIFNGDIQFVSVSFLREILEKSEDIRTSLEEIINELSW